jgi:phospholipid transport system substrate-binding protein
MNDNKTAAVAPAIAPAGLLGRATRFRLVCALFLVIGLFAAGPRQAAAQDPRAFVAELGHQAIQVLGRNVPSAQRIARFRELFHDDFDVSGIGQFVLGRYWRVATPAEQQEFLRLFQEYIVQSYATRLAEYGGEPFRVLGTRASGNETVVSSEIDRPDGSRVLVDWYLLERGGAPKISDVYVGGVSMKVTERDQFAAVIQRNGGRVDALLAQLRHRLQAF